MHKILFRARSRDGVWTADEPAMAMGKHEAPPINSWSGWESSSERVKFEKSAGMWCAAPESIHYSRSRDVPRTGMYEISLGGRKWLLQARIGQGRVALLLTDLTEEPNIAEIGLGPLLLPRLGWWRKASKPACWFQLVLVPCSTGSVSSRMVHMTQNQTVIVLPN